MSLIGILDAHAVEIRVSLPDGTNWRGSGYVTSPCRIVTALHVLIGTKIVRSGGNVVAPKKIEVRSLGDFSARFPEIADVASDRAYAKYREIAAGDYLWRPARLLWPAAGSPAPQFDLAIIEVASTEALDHVSACSPCGLFECSGRCLLPRHRLSNMDG